MRTWPRDSGRSWHTDIVKPENGCVGEPAMSEDSVATWNWTSGVAVVGIGTREDAALIDADSPSARCG